MIIECGVSFQINTVPHCLCVSQAWGLGLERYSDRIQWELYGYTL